MSSVDQDAQRLIETIGRYDRVIVAFSGGVDSSVVAAAAARADLAECLAVTADSPSAARWQLEIATTVAKQIGIRHQIVRTGEGERPEYKRNDTQRCYYCKNTLYEVLGTVASVNNAAGPASAAAPAATILSGTNADDLGDHRPGIAAGRAAGVVTPLADLEIRKSRVRELAEWFQLSNADLPASPCLASRIAYGVEVTPQRLKRIESAEAWLRCQGFDDLRVRLHADELARVEVPRDQITRLVGTPLGEQLTLFLSQLGFRFVTVDLQGLRSGSLNRGLVQLASSP